MGPVDCSTWSPLPCLLTTTRPEDAPPVVYTFGHCQCCHHQHKQILRTKSPWPMIWYRPYSHWWPLLQVAPTQVGPADTFPVVQNPQNCHCHCWNPCHQGAQAPAGRRDVLLMLHGPGAIAVIVGFLIPTVELASWRPNNVSTVLHTWSHCCHHQRPLPWNLNMYPLESTAPSLPLVLPEAWPQLVVKAHSLWALKSHTPSSSHLAQCHTTTSTKPAVHTPERLADSSVVNHSWGSHMETHFVPIQNQKQPTTCESSARKTPPQKLFQKIRRLWHQMCRPQHKDIRSVEKQRSMTFPKEPNNFLVRKPK